MRAGGGAGAQLLGTDKPLSWRKRRRLEAALPSIFRAKGLTGGDNASAALKQAGICACLAPCYVRFQGSELRVKE